MSKARDKFSPEVRERAVRMVGDHRAELQAEALKLGEGHCLARSGHLDREAVGRFARPVVNEHPASPLLAGKPSRRLALRPVCHDFDSSVRRLRGRRQASFRPDCRTAGLRRHRTYVTDWGSR